MVLVLERKHIRHTHDIYGTAKEMGGYKNGSTVVSRYKSVVINTEHFAYCTVGMTCSKD